MPTMPKVPSFGKVPTLGKSKFGGFGKSASAATSPVVEEVAQVPAAVVDKAPITLSYKYVVFVAENDVEWAYDRDYVIILQRPLGEENTQQEKDKDKEGPQEFLAMVGRKSVGPGKRYWVHSLCSAIVRLRRPNDNQKVDAGIDYVDVRDAATNWVVT